MADEFLGLAEFCEAIRGGDDQAITQRRQEFVSRNWRLINAIDQMADADFAAGNFGRAAHKLGLIEELSPNVTGLLLRRLSAAVRAGISGAIEELAAVAPRLTNDHELSVAVEELLANGRQDLASVLIRQCEGRETFSKDIVATCDARVLATTGQNEEALRVLAPLVNSPTPNLIAMRCQYLLLERLIEFDAALEVCRDVALRWGEERDLRHAVNAMAYVFDFAGADALLRVFADRHPDRAALIAALNEQLVSAHASCEAAIAEHGAVAADASALIHSALSEPQTSPRRILWGKQSLIAFLGSGRMTAADYTLLAWFLPNWEQAPVRHRVLAAARKACPDSVAVQLGWLHYLIANGAYGDAALHCRKLVAGPVDEDSLFFIIMLLRLQKDAIAPAFMTPELFEHLREALLSRIDGTEPGFRCVMRDHFVALGWKPQPWPDDAMPPHDQHEGRGFRRLLAVSTGRLGVISAGLSANLPAAPPLRPVLAISGQLRGFETAWPSIHARLRPLGAPVVVSVWDKTVNAKGRHATRLERMLPDDIVARLAPEERYTETFEVAYPRTASLLFGQTDVDAARVRHLVEAADRNVLAVETESERLLERVLHPHVSPNMLKMYYKFSRLEALIRDAEYRSGAVFSHVIWARPDCEVMRLSEEDLASCLARTDVAWSSFVSETSFGDYAIVLPRQAFALLASIFPRVMLAGDTRLLPWRPDRLLNPGRRTSLDAFGGPDVLFDILLAGGYMPVSRIPRMVVNLRGWTPGEQTVREVFEREVSAKQVGFDLR